MLGRRESKRYLGLAGAAFLLTALPVMAQTLEQGFAQPPNSAMPRVWWHWLNGNVTPEGITADLEWMHRVGIGGFQMFDGSLGVPVFVDKPVIWMTPAWKADWKHAAAEADRLHLEMAMAASGGWSETAGPWVKPEQGMKKYVWSETPVAGPMQFASVLQAPPKAVGKYLDMRTPANLNFPGATDMPGAKPQPPEAALPVTPDYYKDVAVVAYRLPSGVEPATKAKPEVTASSGAIDGAKLADGDYNEPVTLSFPAGADEGWIQFAYDKPYTAQSLMLCSGISGGFFGETLPTGELQASDDGKAWKTIVQLPGPSASLLANTTFRSYAFAPVTARYFRILVKPRPVNGLLTSLAVEQKRDVHLTEAVLSTEPTINFWQDKAAFGNYVESDKTPLPTATTQGAIDPASVVDLTGKMRPDGTLDWKVPEGKWVILRFGYSLTGELNHPATPAATGLEVDKLSKADVQSYVTQYVQMISSTAGEYFGKSFRYFLMDSWEAGNENWTEDMQAEFEKRRGYDLVRWLPALTGHVEGSAVQSDAVLWDFRRTIADMLAENHYATAAAYFKTKGVGLYAEAMGTSLPTTGDGLLNKGQVTISMGEFWTPMPGEKDGPEHKADVREASSAAHIYGKPLVATESFTTTIGVPGWAQSPFYLKPLADENFARGVNRIVVHTSDQQPFTDGKHKPGITLGPFGQDYTRNITWAEQAKAWNSYLARCSYLLQQGRPVGDAAIFYGDGAPATVPFWKPIEPAPPVHATYDFVNADVMQHKATGEPGELVLASGMHYRLLVMPNDMRTVSLATMRALQTLVRNGTVLLGPKPQQAAGTDAGKPANAEVQQIADAMWGSETAAGPHAYGKGKVYSTGAIEAVLQREGLSPDLTWGTPSNVVADTAYAIPRGDSDEDVVFTHRSLPDGELYFVSSQKNESFDLDLSFRQTGQHVEFWHADTGRVEQAPVRVEAGRAVVPVHFDPDGSVFVFFRKGASSAAPMETGKPMELAAVGGPWRVEFAPNLGAPASIEMPSLVSWTENSDAGVKYFSGSATYKKTVEVKPEWLGQKRRVVLDLGTVKEMAEVTINGKPLDQVYWKPPFLVDITDAVKPGNNTVAVKVTNLWPNRMIGDQQPGVAKTYTFTDFHAYKASSPLMESGLMGPVRLLGETR